MVITENGQKFNSSAEVELFSHEKDCVMGYCHANITLKVNG